MIIAVDELPTRCCDCQFTYNKYYDYIYSDTWCAALDEEAPDRYSKVYKKSNCPLKKLNIDGFWGTVYLGEGPNYPELPDSSKKETLWYITKKLKFIPMALKTFTTCALLPRNCAVQ